MSDKIKKVLNTPEVPEELKPENIPSLIKRNNIKQKKNKNIIRYISALTACAVLTVCAVNFIPKNNEDLYQIEPPSNSDLQSDETADSGKALNENLYFTNISDYNEIYNQMKKNYKARENSNKSSIWDMLFGGFRSYENVAINSNADDAVLNDDIDGAVEYENNLDVQEKSADMETAEEAVSDAAATGAYSGGGDVDVYDTLQQVDGIAEADIIKANSECIFFINYDKLNVVPFDNKTGKFGEKSTIDLNNDTADDDHFSTHEMYLTGDILTIIGGFDRYNEYDDYYIYNNDTVVLIYNISENSPKLVESYYQSGSYSDSRMKDNILYLTTNQYEDYSTYIEEDDYRQYIPTCGNTYDGMECINTDDIYIPKDWNNKSTDVEYVNIAGIDINNASEPVSMVSVAGYNGNLYCSNDNIYITHSDYIDNRDKTMITRFSISDGVINPETSGSVDGYVLNQFSMDEYNGYFRIATTSNENTYYYDEVWEEDIVSSSSDGRSNNVFVLDMDMNTVGSITGIAETESIKSVTFKGDIGYVVTYEQTDPLFAIDFSDPCNPVITDEFKINGYSSFLHNWSDDLLLGFGIDADERALEMGVKLVMFDVSDNGNLDECGFYSISGENAHGVMSDAVYDRKALLLSSDKNIIGFPIEDYNSEYQNNGYPVYSYRVFSYENGEFIEKGAVYSSFLDYGSSFIRGIYIGDYICALSYKEAVCIDMNSMEETDRISF